MGVVPSDVLPKRRLEKKSADLEDLRLGGVVEASHEPVAHYEVDRALKRDRFFGHSGLFLQYIQYSNVKLYKCKYETPTAPEVVHTCVL